MVYNISHGRGGTELWAPETIAKRYKNVQLPREVYQAFMDRSKKDSSQQARGYSMWRIREDQLCAGFHSLRQL